MTHPVSVGTPQRVAAADASTSTAEPVDELPASNAGTLNHLLHGPILPTLIRLALPTVAVLLMTTVLSVAETYFVSSLGMNAIAAASLVVPIMMLMTMVASGGIGGGVSSSIARARGAGSHDAAESLVWHALVIGVGAGALFTLAVRLAGRWMYSLMGGSGESLELAIVYSNILFAGAIPFWILMLMQSALRGAGNVKIPALIMSGGVVLGLILSPGFITGWFGLPRLGVAGAGVAQVLCNIVSLAVVIAYMRSTRSNLHLRPHPLRREHFSAILGIGLISTINAFMATLSITALTTAAGVFGVAAIAGYGIASRLDMLLIPVMFGFGTAAITLVGTNIGAGNIPRARRVALVNALFVAALIEVVGLLVGLVPNVWLGLFTDDPDVLAVGGHYLRLIAPLYGFIAINAELFFAGQAARRVGWPLTAGAIRFVFAVAAGMSVVIGHASLETAFLLVALGAVASGLISLFGFWRVRWGEEAAPLKP
ncbi:MATE family efflux transporter [Pseudomonas sp.]|uniref:MATE family efflux transporter n=1 Tax=Pseudomonas sp. TaxID=306 RepID=UPI002627430C|nr:MATE family efflux transporter [Pseudomonas sp.]